MLVALLAAGCAGTGQAPDARGPALSGLKREQAIQVLQLRLAMARRMFRVGERVLFGGVPLCGERVRPAIGLALWNVHSGGRVPQALMREAFGLDGQLQIQEVGDATPAARAGLQRGDRVVTIAGTAAPTGPKAVRLASARLRALAQAGQPFRIGVMRAGRRLAVRARPAPRCAFGYGIVRSRTVNAFADGSRVVVTTGLLSFADSDAELAVVFGHELAHNTLGHLGRTRATTVLGSVGGTAADIALGVIGIPTFGIFSRLGGVAGRRAFSVGFEKEADYVGLYFAALAGYRVETALDIWRRLSQENPRSGGLMRTHPTYAERFAAMQQTVSEIQSKRATGRPLRPNRAADGARYEPIDR